MHFRWWNVITAVAVLAISAFLTEQSKASAGDKVYWHKTVNYNLSRFEQKLRSPTVRKLTIKHGVSSNAQSDKSRSLQPVKILATFDYGESALGVSPATQPAPLKPTPVRCEWARSIVQGYLFEDIEAKTCKGSIYDFEAMRGAKKFSIRVNAINGELIKVEKIESASDQRAHAGTDEVLVAEPPEQ
jgi:hypothetical protein